MADEKIPAGSQLPEKETVVEKVETVPEPKKFAGKYESPEDLENAYTSLEQKMGQQSGEVGAIREQNKMLTEQLLSMQQQKQESPPEPQKDYDKMLKDIAAAYESDDMTFEQALRQSNAITAEQVQAATVQGLEGKFTELQSEFQGKLAERDEQKAVEQFHEANPDFLELQDAGTLDKLKQENPLHDDVSAYFAYKAAQAYEDGKAEQARVIEGSSPAETVISKPGANLQAKQKPNRPMTEAEAKQSMLDSMGG